MPANTKTTKKTKKTPKETKKVEEAKTTEAKEEGKNYFEAIGRRKTAIARVRLFTCNPAQSIGEGNFLINNKNYKEYFPTLILQQVIEAPFVRLKSLNRFNATVKVKGGGPTGQAEAIRLGISRALVLFDINFRKKLKKAGFLTRDARVVERKKFGLKKARRGPQWSKR